MCGIPQYLAKNMISKTAQELKTFKFRNVMAAFFAVCKI